jgi:NifU-like protein involved in Fe-S cluster formation
MAGTTEGKLYSPALLSLATELAAFPVSDGFGFTASERSRTCGSTIDIGLDVGTDGRIDAIGLRVSACAVGQASAALLARSVTGKTCEELNAAFHKIANWLGSDGDLPDWPGIEALEPARGYAGRHEALLLPWKAASSALCKPVAAS